MKNKMFRIGLVGLSLFVMALVTLLAGGVEFLAAEETTAAVAPNSSEVEIVKASDEIGILTPDANYWTPERMAQAVPYPLPKLEGSPDRSLMGQLEVLSGEPFFSAGAWPGQEAISERQTMHNLEVNAPQELTGYDYPPPFSRYRNLQTYRRYPYITVGKIFFNQNGGSFVCSGALIDENTVWTAGHCISDGKCNFSTNVVFAPAYKNGSTPFGTQGSIDLILLAAWHFDADSARDYGTIILDSDVGNTTGWLGFAANIGREQHWIQIGYPAGFPFDGYKQQICASSFSVADNNFSPAPNGAGCDMTGGSSGGPWIYRFGRNNGNYLNGNVSYGYSGFDQETYSPYLDNGAVAVYDASTD